MNDAATMVSIITLAACLFLAVRSLRGRNVHRNRMIVMGVIWAVVIAGLAYVLQGPTP